MSIGIDSSGHSARMIHHQHREPPKADPPIVTQADDQADDQAGGGVSGASPAAASSRPQAGVGAAGDRAETSLNLLA